MSSIVGIGGSVHDFATCLIQDGQIKAIEDERITRVRYAWRAAQPCQPSLNYCLNWAKLHLNEVDQIVSNDALPASINADTFPNLVPINHHLAHAYSAFFTSLFEEAAILIADGAGSLHFPGTDRLVRETTTYAWGRGNDITLLGTVSGLQSRTRVFQDSPRLMCNSIGEFYRTVTEVIGFGWLQAGKTMGLASYGLASGDDRFVADVMKCIHFLPEGQFEIEIDGEHGLVTTLLRLQHAQLSQEDLFKHNAALAYAGQAGLLSLLTHALDFLATKVETSNLCIAGGVGLNSMANGLIPAISKFKNVHVFFAPNDSGTAVGAAIWGAVQQKAASDQMVRFTSGPFWGRPYSLDLIADELNRRGIAFSRPDDLLQRVAAYIASDQTVAWYQGGSEFGPRALGNRSILANPCSPTMRDHINFTIKQREWFRPLAPVVLDSAAATYFNIGSPSPWMQFVWPVHEEFHSALPAITHVDGSARTQTLQREANPRLYALIEEFQQMSQIPMLLNTSFNTQGSPIVETPAEAIDTFINSQIDVLVLEDFLITKTGAPARHGSTSNLDG